MCGGEKGGGVGGGCAEEKLGEGWEVGTWGKYRMMMITFGDEWEGRRGGGKEERGERGRKLR